MATSDDFRPLLHAFSSVAFNSTSLYLYKSTSKTKDTDFNIDFATWQPRWYQKLFWMVCKEILKVGDDFIVAYLPLCHLSVELDLNEVKTNFRNEINFSNDSSMENMKIMYADLLVDIIFQSIYMFKRYNSNVRNIVRKICYVVDIAFYDIERRVSFRLDEVKEKMQSKKLNKLSLKSNAKGSFFSKVNPVKAAKIGAAVVVGGTVLGLTGGLAAPAIGAGLTALGTGIGVSTVTSMGILASSTAGVAITTTLFTAGGATLHGYKMSKRLNNTISEMFFHPIEKVDDKYSRLGHIIVIHGFIKEPDTLPDIVFSEDSILSPVFDKFLLVWERKLNSEVGNFVENFAVSQALNMSVAEIAKHTTLASLFSAFALPSVVINAAKLIDNPWAISINKARVVGSELASILKNQSKYSTGKKPVTLFAYSVACVAVFQCMLEIFEAAADFETHRTKKSESQINPYIGIVDNIILIGSPTSEKIKRWQEVLSMISGKLFNCYSSKDWILSVIHRGSGNLNSIAGLGPVKVDGIVNIDLSTELDIKYHFQYSRPNTCQSIASHLTCKYI